MYYNYLPWILMYSTRSIRYKGHFLALVELEENFWDSLDKFCKFFWDTYWLLLAQVEINEKLRDSL